MRGRCPRLSTLAQLHARCTPMPNGCILYPEVKHSYGIVVTIHGRRTAAHAAWELANGTPMPETLEARHTCDTPRCVNPAHIEAGTHEENMRDRSERGRCNTHASAAHRLSPKAIASVLNLRSRGLRYREIASLYGVHPNCIGRICRKALHANPCPALQSEAA